MLMIAFLCASFLLLVMALQRQRRGWGLWLGYVAVTHRCRCTWASRRCSCCPAQVLVLAWHRRRITWVLSGLVAAGLLLHSAGRAGPQRGSSQIFWIPPPNPFTTKQVLLTLASGGLEPQFYSASGDVLLRLTEVLAILGALGVVWQLLRSPRAGGWRPVLIAGWLFGPAALSWVDLGARTLDVRGPLPADVASGGVAADGLADRGAGGTRRGAGARGVPRQHRSCARWQLPPIAGRVLSLLLRALAAGLLVGLLLLRTLQLAPSYGVSTEPWRAVTRHVVAAFRPGDCIAFYPLDSRMPFRYYLPPGRGTSSGAADDLPWSRTVPFVEIYSTLTPAQLNQVVAAVRPGVARLRPPGPQRRDGARPGPLQALPDPGGRAERAATWIRTPGPIGAARIVTAAAVQRPAREVRRARPVLTPLRPSRPQRQADERQRAQADQQDPR